MAMLVAIMYPCMYVATVIVYVYHLLTKSSDILNKSIWGVKKYKTKKNQRLKLSSEIN